MPAVFMASFACVSGGGRGWRRLLRWGGALLLCALPLLLHAQQSEQVLTIHVVQRGETLFGIAQRYGLDVETLAALNSIADPSNIDIGQRLLVPTTVQSDGTISHLVQPGETLSTIGEFYGLGVDELMALNGLSNTLIYVGQELRVRPAETQPDPAGDAVVVPQASPDQTGTLLAAAPAESVGEMLRITAPIMHVVQPGETLFRIAQRYSMDVAQLAAANGITDPDSIYTGQSLLITQLTSAQLTAMLPAPVTSLVVMPEGFVEGRTGTFRIDTALPSTATVEFLGQTVPAGRVNDLALDALFGIPMGTAPGVYPAIITITDPTGVRAQIEVNIQVMAGGYQQDADIQLVGDSAVLLDINIENSEQALLQAMMTTYTPDRYFDGAFGLPAAATMTSAFGNSRSYNGGSERRVHAGVDFGGVPGTPIFAPAAGQVVMVDTLTVRGLATIIDHGWGVFTGYWHQSESYVRPGQMVEAGQTIGTIGASGRVSGPHLHWEMWVAGTPVDPLQWTTLPFAQR
jgi:murein DD-endopeptidase MepM/ murein hydrolase activator NlpD